MARELKKRKLPFVRSQWIEYYDEGGRGWAEMDFFIELKDEVLLLEVKLTGGQYGKLQMDWLYRPLLEHIFKKPVRMLQVCKMPCHSVQGELVRSLEEWINSKVVSATWHWMG